MNSIQSKRSAASCGIILAGGLGTRIRLLAPGVPKPLVRVAGLPFIEWVLRHLAAQGLKRFVVSLGHLADVAIEYLAHRPPDGLSIGTVQESSPLGTGGATLVACRAAGAAEVFVVANGDSLVLAQLAGAWRLLEDDRIDGVVLGLEMNDASRYGRLVTDECRCLASFAEKQPGSGLINAGVYLLRRRLLDGFPAETPCSLERDVFPALLSGGARLAVLAVEAPFLDIGTPSSLVQAEPFIRRYFSQKASA